MSVAVSSCFTGVESTPRITDRQVRRDVGTPTPEEVYLNDVTPGQLDSWQPGKPFLITDGKASLIFNERAERRGPASGSRLYFNHAVASRDLASRESTDIIFTDSTGQKFTYSVVTPLDSLGRTTPRIPFTIPLEIVDSVRGRLQGKELWILTSVWRDLNNEVIKGNRFIPVTITDISPGSDAYPVKLTFTDTVGNVGRLNMSVGPATKRFRSFGALFSFTDPYLRYRNITPEIWKLIIAGQVKPGMTRDECRLALGTPVDISSHTGYSYLHETWRYESGDYLIFEDGRLVRYNIAPR